MRNKHSKCAFSLAEALITLLIVCLITLASIPILTKKHRMKTNEQHGVFACYWDGDRLVSKYLIKGQESEGTTTFDAQEGRNGCVFNPVNGSKNYVVTIVGAGGGGAAGFAEDMSKVYTNGTSATFTVPVTTEYEFLVAGGGGGGGRAWGGCGNARDWPCGTSGTPGAVVVSYPTLFDKDSKIGITSGAYGARGERGVVGSLGGDSKISYNSDAFFIFAQGGGGGTSPDFDGKNDCHKYENTYSSSTAIYNRTRANGNCSSKGTARDYGDHGGMPGGFSYRGFKLASYKNETSLPRYWEYEKNGAYLLDSNWDYVKTYGGKNQMIPKKNTAIYATNNSYNARRPYRNSLMTRDLMDKFEISSMEDQSRPFASGSAGDLSEGWGSSDALNGGPGVVSILWHQSYGGLGGKPGNVLQTSFAELPAKTLVFPGKGGAGGFMDIRKSLIFYVLNPAAAKPGESSYLKNNGPVLGGKAAVSVDNTDPSTYYMPGGDQGAIGQNGELANVSPTVKEAGGAGGKTIVSDNGYINNNSINGLSREIFKDNNAIGTFNKIIGAGAGGGGGTSLAKSVGAKNILNQSSMETYARNNFGSGGRGSSGLVFIQW